MPGLSRRQLLTGLACSGVASVAGGSPLVTPPSQRGRDRGASVLDIIRPPSAVVAFLGLAEPVSLVRAGSAWEARRVRVRIEPGPRGLDIHVAARVNTLTHVQLRWETPVPDTLVVLGDAWERSYGDLHWGGRVPERVMPWYFMASDGGALHGYGVRTGCAAFCFWQLDPDGISLWLDVSNGGSGVDLGERELQAATAVAYRGGRGDDIMAAATAFCAKLCDAPRLPSSVVYGSNDWYYAYGKNSAQQILRDAELMSSLAPPTGARPFTVVDDGWGNRDAFPDMAGLAQAIRKRGVRPGLWIRPLQAPTDAPDALLLPKERSRPGRRAALAYDPTVPEALAAVLDKVRQASAWGYELIKHDYTTFELFGRWGSDMGAQPALAGWSFHDRGRTSAEIVRELYAGIRRAAGDAIVIGCNTVGHLAAGLFEIQRTGDDTSGRDWERTRRMGVNTLAYRLPQHRTFFVVDADCVPVTAATPWALNRQWLDLVARSGTALFVSPEPQAIGSEQRKALREAFQIAASGPTGARPLDWQSCTTPAHWEFRTPAGTPERKRYDWYPPSGAWPYQV